MSNQLAKILKNSTKYEINQERKIMCHMAIMTGDPDKVEELIDNAIEQTKKIMTEEFQKQLKKVWDERNRDLLSSNAHTLNVISTELIYELANQMGFWTLGKSEDEKYVRNQIKDRVQEIYENTMKAIANYAECNNEEKSIREYEHKKKLVEKNFKIKF